MVYYELVLRGESLNERVKLVDYTYLRFGFVYKTWLNITFLKYPNNSKQLKRAIRIFAFAHYFMIISIVIFQLNVLKVI